MSEREFKYRTEGAIIHTSMGKVLSIPESVHQFNKTIAFYSDAFRKIHYVNEKCYIHFSLENPINFYKEHSRFISLDKYRFPEDHITIHKIENIYDI